MRIRYIYTAVLFLFVIHGSTFSMAASYSIGVKVWAVELKNDYLSDDLETDGFLYGPNLFIRSNHLFCGISASFGTLKGDYEYYDYDYDYGSDYGESIDLELERKDVDIFAGYMFESGFGILAGYKIAKLTINLQEDYYGYDYDDEYETEYDGEAKGPVIGINYSHFISDTNFIIFGNLCYGKLEDEESYDVDAAFLEAGLGFKFPSAPLSVTVSYKYHNYDYETDYEEQYAGVSAGLNYLIGN